MWNFAVYYQVYSDFQYQSDGVLFRDPEGALGTESPVVNVKEAESYGFDSDYTMLMSSNWLLSAAISYNKAELTDAKNTPCTNDEPIADDTWAFNSCDLTGQRAGNLPEWSANLATEYWRSFGGFSGEWYLRGLLNAESEYYSSAERQDLDSYATLDLYLGVRAPESTWDISLWVKNVTDESAELKNTRFPQIPDYDSASMVDSGYVFVKRQLHPRTMGITLGYSF
jgi:iron complex outermembrane receptor protein